MLILEELILGWLIPMGGHNTEGTPTIHILILSETQSNILIT